MKGYDFLALLLFLAVAGCGGSGGGSDTDGDGGLAYFYAAGGPVENIDCETGSSFTTTDQDGAFSCAGDVRFYVGDILLGSTRCKGKITPLDLAAGIKDDDARKERLLNIYRLLQVADKNLSSYAGRIAIDEAFKRNCSGPGSPYPHGLCAEFEWGAERYAISYSTADDFGCGDGTEHVRTRTDPGTGRIDPDVITLPADVFEADEGLTSAVLKTYAPEGVLPIVMAYSLEWPLAGWSFRPWSLPESIRKYLRVMAEKQMRVDMLSDKEGDYSGGFSGGMAGDLNLEVETNFFEKSKIYGIGKVNGIEYRIDGDISDLGAVTFSLAVLWIDFEGTWSDGQISGEWTKNNLSGAFSVNKF